MGSGKERESAGEKDWIVQENPCPWEGSEFTEEPMAIDLTTECASNVMRGKRRKREQGIKRGKGREALASSGESTKAKV